MKYDLLKPCGFSLLVFFAKCQSIFSDSLPVQSGTQLFLSRFSDEPENDNAVCNDGTKGGYYFSPASLAEADDTFVIHLPGGGQCYDEDSCNERWKFKSISMSSTNFPATKYKKGFMDNSMKKTPFWSANKVMLGYCSSDGYMGDAAASEETWGWHFRGQQLVLAMVRDLIRNHRLSSTSTIVFSGGSAGARGVMVLIDLLVADYFPKGSKVLGFLDSPYYIDVPSFSPLYKGFQYEESMKYKHMNTKNIISPECAAVYPEESEQWKCQFGQYRMPFVKTSYFLISSQYDSYQLQMGTQTMPPYGKSATEFVTRFGSTFQNSIIALRDLKLKESLSKSSAAATYAFYSWTCYNHDVSASSDFHTMAVDEGVTQKDALEAFLKASAVVFSSTKGVVGSEYGSSGVSVSSVGSKGSKGKKDKILDGKGKLSNTEGFDGVDKISSGAMRDDSNNVLSKKGVDRVVSVHSWVDSCSGMNCGSSCSLAPVSKVPKAARDRMNAAADGRYDIQSMGGESQQNAGKSNAQMLSQYNAESDSEEDVENSDEKPLFKPTAPHNRAIPTPVTSITAPAAVVAVAVAVVIPLNVSDGYAAASVAVSTVVESLIVKSESDLHLSGVKALTKDIYLEEKAAVEKLDVSNKTVPISMLSFSLPESLAVSLYAVPFELPLPNSI
jgi:O-palmitoleoyl-L-serine hydrolase